MELPQRRLVLTIILLNCLQFFNSASSSFYASDAMRDATTAPTKSYYDYIIVGGGTAGCPLATTLSNGGGKVLLLERGDSPYGNPNITRKENFGKPLKDRSPTSPAQLFTSTDGVNNVRGRALGGTSCLNAGFFSRASAQYVIDAKWDPALVLASYRWVEKQVVSWPEAGTWQTAVAKGLVEKGVRPFYGFSYDHLVGTKFGGTTFDPTGERHTAADLLATADPETLTVLLHATVEKLLFDKTATGKPVAAGVVYVDSTGVSHTARLKKGPQNAVILSAGTLGSPQLLMLSGIGPKSHLQAKNIPVVLDRPMIGQFMSDNPMNAVFIQSPSYVNFSLVEAVGITGSGVIIEAAGGGDKVLNVLSTSDVPVPDIFKGGVILEKVEKPLSKGTLELKTLDVRDNPSVTFNYFSEPEDLRKCVNGLQVIHKVINSKAFAPFYDKAFVNSILWPWGTPFNGSLEMYCKEAKLTIWHYHGGCLVGKVVDHDYKVLGVDALRVIDSSTFDKSPGTNPQASVMMLGRYMGIKMLGERRAYIKTDFSNKELITTIANLVVSKI